MSNTAHFSHIYSQHLGMQVCVEHVQMCVYSMCVLYGMRKFNSKCISDLLKTEYITYKEMSCAILVTTSDAITKFPITPVKKES